MKNETIIDDAAFPQVEAHKGPKFVEFFATWCPHCQRMAPIISSLAEEYEGKIKFFLVDVDKAPEASDKYAVSSTPTMFFFQKDAENAASQTVGEQKAGSLRDYLENIA